MDHPKKSKVSTHLEAGIITKHIDSKKDISHKVTQSGTGTEAAFTGEAVSDHEKQIEMNTPQQQISTEPTGLAGRELGTTVSNSNSPKQVDLEMKHSPTKTKAIFLVEAENADREEKVNTGTVLAHEMENTTEIEAAIPSGAGISPGNTDGKKQIDIGANQLPNLDLHTEFSVATSPEKHDQAVCSPVSMDACCSMAEKADKSYQEFRTMYQAISSLVLAAEWCEEDGPTATRHSYESIADTMRVSGELRVTHRTRDMIEETAHFQAMRLHINPTLKTLRDFWVSMDKVQKRWGLYNPWKCWNISQIYGTLWGVQERKFDTKTINVIHDQVKDMVEDIKDIRLRFIANIDNWLNKVEGRLWMLHNDLRDLIRPLGVLDEPGPAAIEGKFEEWIWPALQSIVANKPDLFPEIIEDCVVYLYTIRTFKYQIWAQIAIETAMKLPGYEEYRARNKEEKDMTLLGALPIYKSVENPPMEIEEVVLSWQSRRYLSPITAWDYKWEEGKSGRSFKTIFRAFISIRGTVVTQPYNDLGQGYKESKNPRFEDDFRKVLKLLEVCPGYSQLPTQELLMILHRAAIQLQLSVPGKQTTFVDKMDPNSGPITVQDLDNHIAQWKERRLRAANYKRENTGGLEKENVQRLNGNAEQDNSINGVKDAGNGGEKNDGGLESTSGAVEQEDLERQEDTYVDAQENLESGENSFADAKYGHEDGR